MRHRPRRHRMRVPGDVRRPQHEGGGFRAVGDRSRLRHVERPERPRLPIPAGLADPSASREAALRGGDPAAAPHGAERIDWDPRTQRCRSVWANNTRVHTQRHPVDEREDRPGLCDRAAGRQWGVEALDWATGRRRFFARAPTTGCSQDALDLLAQAPINPLLRPIVDELPQSCENSFYAATEVGPSGEIWTGTFLGLTIYRPA